MDPINVKVTVYRFGRTCVSWEIDDYFRYHFWTHCDDPELTPEANKLYRNLKDTEYPSHTATLRADAISNAAMRRRVRRVIDGAQLLAQAKADYDKEQADAEAARIREHEQIVERELAMEFFAPLEKELRDTTVYHELIEEIDKVRATLRKKAGLPC